MHNGSHQVFVSFGLVFGVHHGYRGINL
jgi:hypothetical protein